MKTGMMSCMALLLLAGGTASGAEYEFKAPISHSVWNLEEQSRLTCRLVHEIPDYGRVSFTSSASKNRNLYFNMLPALESKNTHDVDVRAIAPSYRPGIPDNPLSTMKNYKYFSGELSDQNAWTLTSALSQGRNLGFFYNDWYYQNRPVQVTVTAINFKKSFRQFTECMNNLLPYSFEDVAFTVLTFDDDTSDLTPESKIRLDRLVTYLSYDPSVQELVIDSYSDSFGTTEHNREASARRANMISKYIEQSSIPRDKIVRNSYGEKEHIASNATLQGRNSNRRVVISVKPSTSVRTKFNYDSPADLSAFGVEGVNDMSAGSEEDINSDEIKGKADAVDKSLAGMSPARRPAPPMTPKEMNSQAAREGGLPDLNK